MEFKSDVYKTFDEMTNDASLARRDPNYTYVPSSEKMIKVVRQPSQTTLITIEKIKAQRRLEEHFDRGGSQVSLTLPNEFD
ncbi:hypothetical protein C9J12_25570 [Photobacterium frigidiphilum]|uniref:Uncharacterized protein n=1 Tax=Photobacterium frigidiphilum TaxID=264736 RepID=A0A2T3J7P1_9GAMM|nr:hypothetical protein [Photobacterium frigidiphilum]PSU44770.1 hypothetical protein C9J12_25570 [Photobacterium frigidiphilum]